MYIEKINGPEDVKKLTVDEMTVMAGEMLSLIHISEPTRP